MRLRGGRAGGDLLPRALEDSLEALRIDRFEQVVEGLGFKGPQRVVIVRGQEDDVKTAGRRHRVEYREAVHVGHLHVEEDQVGIEAADGGERFGAGAGLGDALDFGLLFEEPADFAARGRLIIYDQDPHHV